MLGDAQLEKLHRLAALVPPPVGSEEREGLKKELAVMMRLVKGVSHHTSTGQGRLVDARALTMHDKGWCVTLDEDPKAKAIAEGEAEAEGEGTKVLPREQLLAKVGNGKEEGKRRYQGYLVVDRT